MRTKARSWLLSGCLAAVACSSPSTKHARQATGGTGGDPATGGAGGTGGGAGAPGKPATGGSGGGGGSPGAGGSGGTGGTAGAGGTTPPRDAGATPDAAAGSDARADGPGDVRAPDVGPAGAPTLINVTTLKYDNLRTGWNKSETALDPPHVDVAHFGKLFSIKTTGGLIGQPLLVSKLMVGGKVRNVLYGVTGANIAYAFDADDAAATAPLWMAQFGPVMPPSGQNAGGATATPVIDLASKTLYTVTRSWDNGTASFKLNALDIVTGMPRAGSPAEIAGAVAGTASDAVNGMLAFNPSAHLNRSALLLQSGAVYFAVGAYEDLYPWHGWVFAYDATTLQQRGVFCASPDSKGGGIWMGGNGVAGDGSNVYFATGNGAGNPDPAKLQLAEAFVKLDKDLKLVDWHIRGNYAALDAADSDYASGGPTLLPVGNLAVMGGKDSWVLVYDRNNLGKYKADDTNVVQKFKGTGSSFNGYHMGGFVYWEGMVGGAMSSVVYGWAGSSKLLGFRLNGGKFDEQPVVVGATTQPNWWSGRMVLSSNGPMNGIIWASTPSDPDQHTESKPGKLQAIDASNGKVLWDSDMNRTRDALGSSARWSWPTVANGKVYVASGGNRTIVDQGIVDGPSSVVVYGLLP